MNALVKIMGRTGEINPLKKYDFLVVGSGFGGSITAMGLAKIGYRVLLLERNKHPRFAVGESSTPIADMVLRNLSDEYNLPFLKQLSRYGEWQKHHPEVTCGLKRGFSYYNHKAGEPFSSDGFHSNELLVAASENNYNSDTNWLRSDVDHFLVKQLAGIGVDYLDKTHISDVKKIDDNEWMVHADSQSSPMKTVCKWIVDATGSPKFSQKYLGTSCSSDSFQTNSTAVFSHFQGAGSWHDYLKSKGLHTADYPYNPDHSALHHIIEEGWMWMLRFNNDLLSAGILFDGGFNQPVKNAGSIWRDVLQKYPSLYSIFKQAELAAIPGDWIKTGRLQRRLDKIYGNGWVALNHTAGFVDPMHSTGIAHTLTGVEKILKIFSSNIRYESVKSNLTIIQDEYFNEMSFIDLLVSSVYHSKNDFSLFRASVMLYFIASIRYEQSRLKGRVPPTFLCAGDDSLYQMIMECHSDIKRYRENHGDKEQAAELVHSIQEKIKPYNSVGLMDPEKNNMYEHTAVSL